jgi:hypothetical protein
MPLGKLCRWRLVIGHCLPALSCLLIAMGC